VSELPNLPRRKSPTYTFHREEKSVADVVPTSKNTAIFLRKKPYRSGNPQSSKMLEY
jgi:hypothetical protein